MNPESMRSLLAAARLRAVREGRPDSDRLRQTLKVIEFLEKSLPRG